jgi:16S rRNA C967 or C1407 C5-methylase (RsmB/RsmF family)
MSKKQKHSHAIPEQFMERLVSMVGPSLVLQIEKTFVVRPTTFRVNTLKMSNPPAMALSQGEWRAGEQKNNEQTG